MSSMKSNEVSSVTVGKSSEEMLSNYCSLSSSTFEDKGRGFSFNTQPAPVGTSVQATGPESRIPKESYTVDEQEVFEQEVPPTPIEPKRLHYSTGNDHKERRIDSYLQQSVDVEPVEEKSCESNHSNGKVTEARMDMPLGMQQQCLDKKEEALVIPTLKSKLTLELDNDQPHAYGATQ